MSLRWSPVALGLALILIVAAMLGCGKGEDLPLVAPGAGNTWPADPGWQTLPELFGDVRLDDGVWDEETGRIVLVGSKGAIFERSADLWHRKTSGLTTALRAVTRLGPDEYLAVGLNGGVCHGRAGSWQREDAGTSEDLSVVVTTGETAWAVGGRGTIVRRTAGQWSRLPSAGDADLLGVAVLGDSVFVALADTSTIRVWDGAVWSSLAPPPWRPQRNLGLTVGSDGRLYAAADSLYVRDPAGWRAATDSRFFFLFGDPFQMKVVGQTLWYGTYGWSRIDLTAGAWQPHVDVPGSRSVLAPRDTTTYLTADATAAITWFEDGVSRRDPAGNLGIGAAIPLDEGGLLLITELGIYHRDATTRKQVLALDQLPELAGNSIRSGCGRSPRDYYLTGGRMLYHCTDGRPAVMGTWTESHYITSLALDADGELYMGSSAGLWRWRGTTWERVLPLPYDNDRSYRVWPLGNGSLGARSQDDDYFYLSEGSWRALGRLSWRAILQTGADGSLLAVREMSGTEEFPGGNVLLVYDERAAAFRNFWNRGMGPLVDLRVKGATSRGGRFLIWTEYPTMVFTLDGSPLEADWRLVAGPLAGDLQFLAPMSDGSLLGLDADDRRFHLYRP